MEANQSDLTLPDITEAEQITNENEQEHENGEQKHQIVTTQTQDGNTVVQVPVSLPVGSLIGTAFNVITSDQLPHMMKPLICLDNNGYMSGNVVSDNGEMKTTHIVIQQQPAQDQQQQQIVTKQEIVQQAISENSQVNNNSSIEWASDSMPVEVLPIRCKTTTAELYKARLGSGGRGRCIKHKDQWLTPSEFENLCGRGSSKDWKRSIRYGGRSLQALIDEGILTPHATSCTCAACCDDDATASGPVRLFTPYKRRRRIKTDTDSSEKKKKNVTARSGDDSELEQQQTQIVTKEDTSWQCLTDGIITGAEYLEQTTQVMAEANVPLERLKTLCVQMVKATSEFKRCISEAKEVHARQIARLQGERDAALLAARVHTEDDPNGMQIQGEVEYTAVKKCANCNRDAMAECSLCRKTPYCSTFCQRKDWQSHQNACRTSSEATQQIMFLVDDQGQ